MSNRSNYLFVCFETAAAGLNALLDERIHNVDKGDELNTQKAKRTRKGVSITPEAIEAAVPAFLDGRSALLDKDPGPFEVQWGLRNKDTVIGNSETAAIWSKSVISPRDQSHVVESLDDLQIERLGAQAIASVCFFLLLTS